MWYWVRTSIGKWDFDWEYHNCKIWDGDAFNPERFSEGFSKANTSSSISIWLGDSKCIALSFAMLEANIAPTMIPSYSFELSPSNLLRLWCPTLKINWLCGWKVTGAQGIVFNMLTDCVSFWHFRFEECYNLKYHICSSMKNKGPRNLDIHVR